MIKTGVSMKNEWNYDRCITVLRSEIEVLKNVFEAQYKVRQAVMNREWADFDKKIAEVEQFGSVFTCLEEERAMLFSALSDISHAEVGIEEKPFYALIMTLPAEQSRELSNLHRELKMQTLKMRALSETFMAYLTEAKTMASAYLEAVCPARGGKLYTRKGRRVSQDLKSIVFNSRF